MADDFIDKNFCSEKCRKLGQARASLAKSLANVVKVTVKRKSAAAEAAAAAAEAASDRSAVSGDPLKEAEPKVLFPSWIWFGFKLSDSSHLNRIIPSNEMRHLLFVTIWTAVIVIVNDLCLFWFMISTS